MSGTPRICAVVLAAGASSRMGRDKALLPWPPSGTGDRTLLSAAILALKPFTEAVIVVASRNAEQLAPIAARHGASIAINPAPDRGQFSSMQIGLRAVLDCGCDAAMLTPVDCPPLSAATLELLRDSFVSALARGKWAVAPENNGRRGHPLLASRELIEAYLAAPATSNARDVKQTCAQLFEYVPVADRFLSADMNTPEEYAAVSAQAVPRRP
jgi:molybdenum cofactor cytidylyltransferase